MKKDCLRIVVSLWDYGFLYWMKSDGHFWFRLFGVGLAFKDTDKHGLLFGERNGHTKFLRVGKWIIKILK